MLTTEKNIAPSFTYTHTHLPITLPPYVALVYPVQRMPTWLNFSPYFCPSQLQPYIPSYPIAPPTSHLYTLYEGCQLDWTFLHTSVPPSFTYNHTYLPIRASILQCLLTSLGPQHLYAQDANLTRIGVFKLNQLECVRIRDGHASCADDGMNGIAYLT